MRSAWRSANLLLKVLVVALALAPIAFPELPQFQGKAMGARAVTFPLAAVLVPLAWWARGRPRPYPHVMDALLVLPFVIDLAGNLLDLYDSFVAFDDVCHWLNWALLSTAFGVALAALPISRLNAAALVAGFGTIANVLWELAEWVVMQFGSQRLQLTYGDTIGDLALSTLGAFTGAWATAVFVWRRREVAGRPLRA